MKTPDITYRMKSPRIAVRFMPRTLNITTKIARISSGLRHVHHQAKDSIAVAFAHVADGGVVDQFQKLEAGADAGCAFGPAV